MALVRAIGGDGYSTTATLNAHPDWTANNSTATFAFDYLPVTVPGERWLSNGVNGGSPFIATGAVPMPNFEYECSQAFRPTDDSASPQLAARTLWVLTMSGSTGAGGFASYTLGFDILGQVNISGVGITTQTIAPPGTIEVNKVYYTTLRAKRQSAQGVADGVLEIWINNVLIFADYALDGQNLERLATWTELLFQPRVQSTNRTKNITLFDQWTTAEGVAPDILRVFDNDPVIHEETTAVVTLPYYIAPEGNKRYLNTSMITL